MKAEKALRILSQIEPTILDSIEQLADLFYEKVNTLVTELQIGSDSDTIANVVTEIRNMYASDMMSISVYIYDVVAKQTLLKRNKNE